MMASEASLAPDFIRFLFSSKLKFDCYFKFTNESQDKPERIGAVKLMLMAHSEVFRTELEYSKLKEKDDVPIVDIHPETFRGMLKYVYGHDTTSDMCFDEADNLLYVAEKYMMKTLKDKLATRLMKLLSPDNICSLLNNPACYTHLELNSAITDILRYETDHILASPQFLLMNADGFLRILEQDGLAVPEIELWRAAIKWAKHRANSDDGQLMRQQLSGVSQHLRLCSLTITEFCEVIAPTDVLTKEEIGTVCQSIVRKEKPQNLNTFSSETEQRKILRKKIMTLTKMALTKLTTVNFCDSFVYIMTLLTKRSSIELLPLVCKSEGRNTNNPEHWTYKVNCTTTITKVANPKNPDSSSANEPPITITYSENVKYGVEFEIPLAVDGRNITLQPDNKYQVMLQLSGKHRFYNTTDYCRAIYENDHLSLHIVATRVNYSGNSISEYKFPSNELLYKVVTTAG